ncbi:MAG: T9SS type A sorting domain-containing protein [Bacteroidales bacterium]|nr:T9SS type A sorting domain-containing protein [Bacteroidales bacterium]
MKRYISELLLVVFLVFLIGRTTAQLNFGDDFIDIQIDTLITQVQPMTGIVFWQGEHIEAGEEAISMEFSYLLFNDVVVENGVYNWDAVEVKLADIASRKHQAIFRFRYVYPGYETSVPDYLKAMDDYNETEGISEGKTTWFPDWTNAELQRFTLEFYTKFAERYDNDPRLAFIQVGFGLWAEYHIYDGPFELGVTFPSKAFQEDFFRHLDTTFVLTPFSCSIDAADDAYSPFEEKPGLLNLHFGNFDDSFMHDGFGEPGNYNTESWNFFGRERYKKSPAGGEFSYYSDYDQQHVLDWPDGPYGKPWEFYAEDFHMTYIIGNDQPNYQTTDRIKQASLASGYRFKIVSFKTKTDSSVVVVKNSGVAPIYYDAFISVNGVRSPQSLKLLAPGETLECTVSAGGNNPLLTIESDRLAAGQSIGYLGTENFSGIADKRMQEVPFNIFPTILQSGGNINVQRLAAGNSTAKIETFGFGGLLVYQTDGTGNEFSIGTGRLKTGVYFLRISGKGFPTQTQKIIIQ